MSKLSENKLSFGIKSFYATGAISDVIMANIIGVLAFPLYVTGLGISPILIGYALSIPRLWDAVTDPLMGNISDNSQLRCGRRRPYMFIGAILGGLLCALLWMPPTSLSEKGIFIYFLITSILFFTAYTIYSVPFNALGYELSNDYDERTSVMSYKTFFMNAGAAFILPSILWLCMRPQFGNSLVEGARVVGVLFGGLVAVFGILAAIFSCEKLHKQNKIDIFSALKYTFSNKTFLLLSMIVVCVLIGILAVFPLVYFLNLSYLFPNDQSRTATAWFWYQTTYGVMGILGVPVINYLGQRFGKKPILLVGLTLISLMFPASWFLFNPNHPWLQLVFAALVSPGLSFVWVLTSSMMADVCDLDELKTGLRREGAYGSIFTLLVKLGVSVVMLVSGYVLIIAGYDQKAAIQTPEAVYNLRLFFVFLPIVFMAIAMVLTFLYPLSKAKMEIIHQKLNEQKNNLEIL